MFLPPSLTNSATRYVKNGPAERLPVFKRDTPHVVIGGSILRYSTTTEPMRSKKVPGGYKLTPRP